MTTEYNLPRKYSEADIKAINKYRKNYGLPEMEFDTKTGQLKELTKHSVNTCAEHS